MNRISKADGFTLVEILIVVVILGVLAAIVVPQFASAAEQSRENSLKMDLYRIRQQIMLYKEHHSGSWPTLADFEDQMTLASNTGGATAAPGTPGFPYGPYLRAVPINPNTSTATIGNGGVGSSDWYYNAATGDFRANDTAETFAY